MRATDLLGCVGPAIILLFSSTFIPFLGPFLTLLTPIPFLYYTTKLGLQHGLKIVVVAILAVALVANFTGNPQIIFLCVEFSLLGLILSEIFKKRFTLGLTIFWGTAFMLVLGACVLIFISITKSTGPLDLILSYLDNNFKQAIGMYETMGSDQDKIRQLQEYAKVLKYVITRIYPALMVIGTAFVVWINVVISRPLFHIRNLRYPDFGPIDRWHSPDLMIWGVIVAGFSLFLSIAGVKLLAINALIVMLAIYAFHGLSIVLFYFNKYRVPPWVRFGVYLIIIFQQIFLVLLAMAGLFDQWIDFRKIHKKPTG
ncbi:MAG: YybS family protein [Deltaproteobacteria bacterium]|nr:YybS family protein [Deltaproteobacteria bacterium]